MSENDELKEKFGELAKLLKVRLVTRIKAVPADASQFFGTIANSKDPNKQKRNIVILVVVTLVAGVFLGSLLSGGGSSEPKSKPPKKSLVTYLFGQTIPVPGSQADGSFVFADYETEIDLKAWSVNSAKISLSEQHAFHGKQAAKVTFFTGQEISGITLDDYFESKKGLHDWTKYEFLRFYVYNPRKINERLILQVKDRSGSRYKQDIWVPGGNGKDYVVEIKRLGHMLNIREIEQISLFRWAPKGDRDFFIDHIRLVPANFQEKGAVEPTPNLKINTKSRSVNPMDYGFSVKKPAWVVENRHTSEQYVRIPFIVKNENPAVCVLCPIEGGIPFPLGEVKSLDHLRLKNSAGQELPFQGRILSQWPDQSIRWLNVHFKATLKPKLGIGFFLEYDAKIKSEAPTGNLKVNETPDHITIHTGPLEAQLSKTKFYLFDQLKLDLNSDGALQENETIVNQAPLTLGFRNETYWSHLDSKTYRLIIEEQGPLKAVLRAEGWFQSEAGKRFGKVIIRYYFYHGLPHVKVAHTLIYTGFPENSYYDQYKGLKLPDNEPIDFFSLEIPLDKLSAENSKVYLGIHNAPNHTLENVDSLSARQLKWNRGTVVQNTSEITNPEALAGWIDVSDQTWGVTAAVRHFRENFPKAFNVDLASQKSMKIDLWPREAGKLDLSTTSNAIGPEARARGSAFGLGKTHEILFYFHPRPAVESRAIEVANSFNEPTVLRNNPYWVDASGVLGRIVPPDQRAFKTESATIEKLFDWAARHPKDFKWYGMLNFGDTLTWWRNEDDSQWYGEHDWYPIGRWGWYNCEGLGLHAGALLNFARTANWKYFEFGANLARHIMDVDTVHYNTIANDSRLKVMNEEFSKVGSMHRHNGDHWGGRNEEASHTNVVGIILYHYLSGDERAREVALEVGEFFLGENFTYTGHPDIAPHRGIANALWGDVMLYEMTGDEKYKTAADKLIQIYLEGQESDGSFRANYNPLDQTWSGNKHRLYMEGYALGAVIAYHQLTQDEEVKTMLLDMTHYLGRSRSGASSIHGFAYAYFLTGDPEFIKYLEGGINELVRNQQHSANSIEDGLIYQKPIYHRVNAYLYPVVYAFAASDASRGAKR